MGRQGHTCLTGSVTMLLPREGLAAPRRMWRRGRGAGGHCRCTPALPRPLAVTRPSPSSPASGGMLHEGWGPPAVLLRLPPMLHEACMSNNEEWCMLHGRCPCRGKPTWPLQQTFLREHLHLGGGGLQHEGRQLLHAANAPDMVTFFLSPSFPCMHASMQVHSSRHDPALAPFC